MENTNQKLISQKNTFEDYYIKRKNNSFELGKASIDALIDENKEITFRSISSKSKEIDPIKKGISTNTIKNNSELYEYYNKYRSYPNRKTTKPMSKKLIGSSIDTSFIKTDRDVSRVRQRYLTLTKSELVDRIIVLEQYIANNQQLWLENQFAKYSD